MNDFGWKERLGLTEQWVAPTFQGFATTDELVEAVKQLT